MEEVDFTIKSLGECKIQSPLLYSRTHGEGRIHFTNDETRIIVNNTINQNKEEIIRSINSPHLNMEKAGAREKLFFNPAHVHAAIVTCGGLCPGLNDIIRSLVKTLMIKYKVPRVSGIKYGYSGFLSQYPESIIELSPSLVDDIHTIGGTILGSSRGGGDKVVEIVDALERLNINMLFVVGGDGTQRGSLDIHKEITKRGHKISIIGIPKTIDNDINYVHQTFGFETAVSKATMVVHSAHVEAASAYNGIGLVKIMGRHSGFITTHTAIATHEANFVLIPEVEFSLKGEKGLLNCLEKRLKERKHAVILVAEGAGQEFLAKSDKTDASGNIRLADIGLYLKDEITQYFEEKNIPINLKYIDPSYIIRASVANPHDAYYCSRLGTNAVHAAMAGKTAMVISYWAKNYVHVPIETTVSRRNIVRKEGSLWREIIESTGQPINMKDE